MTGLGIAVAFVLLLWCSLLYVPFRWRPAGLYLITPKALAAAYAPFIALLGIALAVVGAVFGSWWIAVPAAVAAAAALAVVARVGAVRPDLAGALGAGLGRPDPGRAPQEHDHPLVDRTAAGQPGPAAAPGRAVRDRPGYWPRSAV